jgi:membrane protease YdiL (CAAX protease family)
VILVGGYFCRASVRRLVAYADTNPARLGFEMLGIEIGLAASRSRSHSHCPARRPRRLGLGRAGCRSSAVIALALGTLGLSHAFDALFPTRARWRAASRSASRAGSSPRAEQFDFVIAFVGSVVAPAIGEELLCRGLLQRGLALWMRPIAAIAISALAFGWLHMELVHGALAASIGLYLGFAAYWSDSTRPRSRVTPPTTSSRCSDRAA